MEISAHKAQLEFASCAGIPYIGFVGGRGAGKSTALAMRLYKWSLMQKGLYGCYAPTYPLLNDTILRVFTTMAKPHILEHNQSKGIIRMFNGSEIICRSLDDPERARGPSLRGAVWDEASLCSQEAFDILIACLRYEGKQGWLACGFTPRGLDHWTAKVFNDPQRPDAKCFHATTKDNPFNPPQFADTLRRQYTTMFAQQELEGAFISTGGSLMRREWFRIIEPTAIPPLRSIFRYWDMASTPSTGNNDPDWTAGAKVAGTQDGRWVVLDMRHARLSPAGNEMLVQSTANEDGKQVQIVMEEEGGASGKSLVDHYRRRLLVGYSFKGDRPSGDKIIRAMPLAAAAEAGNVMLVKGAWNKAFLDEAEQFGEDAIHDDQMDAVAGAVNMMSTSIINPHVGSVGMIADKADLPADIQAILDQASSPEERLELESMVKEQYA
ncbi:MAG: phage terminase large subunit [Dehalococcoidales bacterium]|nr:phage terminase large subunit [Dehalococcoidales bacterium]